MIQFYSNICFIHLFCQPHHPTWEIKSLLSQILGPSKGLRLIWIRCFRFVPQNTFHFDGHYCMVYELLQPNPLHHYFGNITPEEVSQIYTALSMFSVLLWHFLQICQFSASLNGVQNSDLSLFTFIKRDLQYKRCSHIGPQLVPF